MFDKSTENLPDALLGVQLGDYVIQSLIGEGGMARVYEGFDSKLGRRAAVKVIEVKRGGDDEDAQQRFIREARAIASLDHPNIVTVYQFGEWRNLYYLAMKYIEGKTLLSIMRQARKQKKYIPAAQVSQIITEIASAIDYAHSRSLIHRDIKPSNIMLTPDRRAILMDFGLTMDSSLNSTLGTAFGTPRYIAPEQAVASHRAVPQSDIYSLGIVLYEMVTNQTPFDDDSPMSLALAHISKAPPNPVTFRPDLSHPLQMVILKALEKRPEDRWNTASTMADALQNAYQGIEPEVILAKIALPKPEDLILPRQEPNGKKGKKKSTGQKGPTPKRSSKEIMVVTPDETVIESRPATALLPAVQPLTDRPAQKKRRRVSRIFPALLILLVVLIGIAAGLLLLNRSSSGAVVLAPTPVPGIRLIYDDVSLTIYNATVNVVPLDNVIFKRDDNTTQSFDTIQFGETTRHALLPNSCLRIRTQSADDSTTPLVCGVNNKNLIKSRQWNAPFWLMRDNDSVDTFSVMRGSQLLKNCSMRINTCEFVLH